jgi:hypothetical protein
VQEDSFTASARGAGVVGAARLRLRLRRSEVVRRRSSMFGSGACRTALVACLCKVLLKSWKFFVACWVSGTSVVRISRAGRYPLYTTNASHSTYGDAVHCVSVTSSIGYCNAPRLSGWM